MSTENKGFDLGVIDEFRKKINNSGTMFLSVEGEEQTEEYVNFYFLGVFEGKQVIYDAVIYTLQVQHNSELYEIAEHKAAKKFPEYKSIIYREDENGDMAMLDDLEEEIGLYMAEVIEELEEEGKVKVKEHLDIDDKVDFGISLEVGLNLEKIDLPAIEKFIKDFNEDTLVLDPSYYSFLTETELS